MCGTGWFAAALLCVSAATVSKEVGATAIGVFAAYDAVVVRGLLRAAAARRARGPSRAKLSTLFGAPFFATTALRVALLGAWFCGAMALRLSLHGDKTLYDWTVLENHVSLEPSPVDETLCTNA